LITSSHAKTFSAYRVSLLLKIGRKKKGDSRFADGINQGRSACCVKLLASVPDGKGNWCPKPLPNSDCSKPPCEPIVDMNQDECQSFLCQQSPMISNAGDSYALWLEQHSAGSRRLLSAIMPAKSTAAPAVQSNAATSAASKSPHLDPNVGRCVEKLRLSGIDSWETSPHCVQEVDDKLTKQDEQEVVEEEKEQHSGIGGIGVADASSSVHEGGAEAQAATEATPIEIEHEPELKDEEIPEQECDEEAGAKHLPILPGANVLGYTYDPEFGLEGCNFDRCVMRPFIRYTYRECKVVETPAGQFKVPDQIFAFNLFETSAQTHIYENEREESKANSVSAHIEGSYAMVTASAHMSRSESGDSSSKQHIAIRKIDVHLYRLTLMKTRSFDSLQPQFVQEFQKLPARFEDNVHDYLEFLRSWGRYVATSGTFGGSVEIKMKFFSASSASKEDFSAGVEMSVSTLFVSVSGGVEGGYSNAAKEINNNNEISIDSSGGDPAIAAVISDVHTAETMSFRADLERWLESVPRYPRLVEDWPILSVLTHFIPNSPSEDGSFDPMTQNQGLLHAMRILHQDGATSMFDKRKCYPPFKEPAETPSGGNAPNLWARIPVIRIFEHCNYKGRTIALPVGDYDIEKLRNHGGFDFVNSISSFYMLYGTKVAFFSQPHFGGEELNYVNDQHAFGGIQCMRSQNFNDIVKSMQVRHSFVQETGAPKKGKIQKALPSGRTTIAFNDFDRIQVGQCISFVAETTGGIDLYLFSSPVTQVDAYSFQVGTKDVKLTKGLFGKSEILKESADSNAVAFGEKASSLPQNVWFCVNPDSEDSSATVFSYGRGSYTLFEHTIKTPVVINYFSLDCSQAATYRSITIMKASRWLETVNPFNRACFIANCQKVQDIENENGACACEKCEFGYQPDNNNQQCRVADQCAAQFGCLSANPPSCVCEECCCGLSFDPVTQNCVNANLMMLPGSSAHKDIAIYEVEKSANAALVDDYGINFMGADTRGMTNKMETKFNGDGSSYRLKKLMFACTETNVQNIRISYDASKPALGFIDYDSTHLITDSDTAGKFDFSVYDNLRKSVEANPIFSASGFLNLDEVKLEEVSLASMAKKSGSALNDMFAFMVEGAQQFAKDVGKAVEDVKNKAVEVTNNLKKQADELIKIADGEVKKIHQNCRKSLQRCRRGGTKSNSRCCRLYCPEC